jgi:BMFP domain-containing protein YqiC
MLLNSKLDSLSIVQQEETDKQTEMIFKLRETNKGERGVF